jgi:uncharacterized protein (TIGR03083 family)
MKTAAMTQVVELIHSESLQLRDKMASLDAEAWSTPSACRGWTVGDVFAHLTQGAYTWRDTLGRALAGDASPPPGQRFLQAGERGSEVTAQRAIALRQETGEAELLQAFTEAYQQLRQVLLRLQPEDRDKPCFHRRGVMSIGDYVARRLQELVIHGWDIRVAFDSSATVSESALPVMLDLARRWLSNTFQPTPDLATPVRYRFDVPGPVPLQQDVQVSQDGFAVEPVAGQSADITFRCKTGDYLLLIYGRLPLDRAVDTGRLTIAGNRQHAALFTVLFQGI